MKALPHCQVAQLSAAASPSCPPSLCSPLTTSSCHQVAPLNATRPPGYCCLCRANFSGERCEKIDTLARQCEVCVVEGTWSGTCKCQRTQAVIDRMSCGSMNALSVPSSATNIDVDMITLRTNLLVPHLKPSPRKLELFMKTLIALRDQNPRDIALTLLMAVQSLGNGSGRGNDFQPNEELNLPALPAAWLSGDHFLGRVVDQIRRMRSECRRDVSKLLEQYLASGQVHHSTTSDTLLNKFFSYSGSVASGIEQVSMHITGDYQRCEVDENDHRLLTHYCTLKATNFGAESTFGLCLPKTCNASDVSLLLHSFILVTRKYMDTVTHKDILESFWLWDNHSFQAVCSEQYIWESYSGHQIFLCAVLSLFLTITIIGNIVNIILGNVPLPQLRKNCFHTSPIFMWWKGVTDCFCIQKNASSLMSTSQSSSYLSSLDMMRTLCMAVIINIHFLHTLVQTADHHTQIGQSMPVFLMVFLTQFFAAAAMDTFFVLSGLLGTYQIMKKLSSLKHPQPKFFWLYVFFHRYIRITPLFILCTYYFNVIFSYQKMAGIGGIHLMDSLEAIRVKQTCLKQFWKSALYINNLDSPDEICEFTYWFLAADMQLFILRLVPLTLLYKKVRPRMILCIAIVIFALLYTPFYFSYYQISAALGITSANLYEAHSQGSYGIIGYTDLFNQEATNSLAATHSMIIFRCPLYFCSVLLGGYLGHISNTKEYLKHSIAIPFFNINRIKQLLLPLFAIFSIASFPITFAYNAYAPTVASNSGVWIARILDFLFSSSLCGLYLFVFCFPVFFAILIFNTPTTYKDSRKGSVTGHILYSISTSRVWIPFSRLCYSVFLTHVMVINYWTSRLDKWKISLLSWVLQFVQILGLCFFTAFIVHIVIERPINNVITLLLQRKWRDHSKKDQGQLFT